MTATRRDAWEHVRYYLVECGEPAREQAQEMVRRLSEEIASRAARTGAVVSNDHFVQVVMVLISFGDASRDRVAALTRHASEPVRAASTSTHSPQALTVGQPVTTLGASAGEVAPARTRRPVLTERLAIEPNATVKQKMLEALGMLREPMSVGPMIGELNEAERRWNEIMKSIDRIRQENGMAALETEVRRIQKERPKDFEEVRQRISEGKPTGLSAADRDLIRRLAEKEALVQPHVDGAMEQKDFLQKLMYALWKVTGRRLNTPAEWRDWWAKQEK